MHLTRKNLLICVQVFHCVSSQGMAQLHKRGLLRGTIAEPAVAVDSRDIDAANHVPQLEGYYSSEPGHDTGKIDGDQSTKYECSPHLTPNTVIDIPSDGKPISTSAVEDVAPGVGERVYESQQTRSLTTCPSHPTPASRDYPVMSTWGKAWRLPLLLMACCLLRILPDDQ